MTQEAYQARIQQAIRLLDGKFSEVEKELETEMLQASEELRFEQAAELRDRHPGHPSCWACGRRWWRASRRRLT